MASSIFKFKQFSLQQDNSAMKVGTDGVLLGAWAGAQHRAQHDLCCDALGDSHGCSILDIGSGTGVISLMMAQECPSAKIVAVEVEELAAQESRLNFANSPWSDRLQLVHGSFQHYAKGLLGATKFDTIITNPPYFIDSLKNEQQAKIAARHTLLLPYEELVKGVGELLSDSGAFYVILPYQQASILITLAAFEGLYLRRRLDVQGSYSSPVKRVLMKFTRIKGDTASDTLVIEKEQRGDYTAKYKEMTKKFYLKF